VTAGAGPPYTLLEAGLGTAVRPALLEQALTHRSFAYEHGGLPTNERLEFLGDSVLGLVVTECLYADHPGLAEGELAKMRASVVNARALAGVARSLDLGRWLRLGRGEQGTGGRDKDSILADTMEAVIGAVHVERGVAGSGPLVRSLFAPLLRASAVGGAAADHKTVLQEATAARGLGLPEYRLTGSGPDHARRFEAEAYVDGRLCGTGEAGTKKHAEQRAAQLALGALATQAAPAAQAPSA